MKLSVVVPAYNEAKRIKKTIARLASYLGKQPYSHEIIVVDDGSQDETHSILQNLAKQFQALRVIHSDANHGKGYAVKCGMSVADGDLTFFTDADLSTPPKEIVKFAKIFESRPADILIGSRYIAGSKIRIPQPCYRQIMGRVFNSCVKLFTPLRFQDTQCGFKAFKKEAAQKLFAELQEHGFDFDLELLLLAGKFDFKVEEIPITWINYRQSKINAITDSLSMFRGVVRLGKKYRSFYS